MDAASIVYKAIEPIHSALSFDSMEIAGEKPLLDLTALPLCQFDFDQSVQSLILIDSQQTIDQIADFLECGCDRFLTLETFLVILPKLLDRLSRVRTLYLCVRALSSVIPSDVRAQIFTCAENLMFTATKISVRENLFGILNHLIPTASLEDCQSLFDKLSYSFNGSDSNLLRCIHRLFKFADLEMRKAETFLEYASELLESEDWAVQADTVAIIRKITERYPELIESVNQSGMIHRLVRVTSREMEFLWVKIFQAVRILILDNQSGQSFMDSGVIERWGDLVESEMENLIFAVLDSLTSAVAVSRAVVEGVIESGLLTRTGFRSLEFRVKVRYVNCWHVVFQNCPAPDRPMFGSAISENVTTMLDASDGSVLQSVLLLIQRLVGAGVPLRDDCIVGLESIALGDQSDENATHARVILESLDYIE
jgi:hypothetical protein